MNATVIILPPASRNTVQNGAQMRWIYLRGSSFLKSALCVSLVTVSLTAQEAKNDESRTTSPITRQMGYKFSNGRTWRDLDRQSKIMWVDGTEEGIFFLMREVYSDASAADRALIESHATRLTVPGFHMSDIVQQIDTFYSDSSNLRVPVVDAYEYSMKKMHGAKQQDLEDYQAKLRQMYNQ